MQDILQKMHEFEEMQQKLLQKQDLYASEIWDMYVKLDQIINQLEQHSSDEAKNALNILRETHWKIWQLYQECPNFVVVSWNKLWHSVW